MKRLLIVAAMLLIVLIVKEADMPQGIVKEAQGNKVPAWLKAPANLENNPKPKATARGTFRPGSKVLRGNVYGDTVNTEQERVAQALLEKEGYRTPATNGFMTQPTYTPPVNSPTGPMGLRPGTKALQPGEEAGTFTPVAYAPPPNIPPNLDPSAYGAPRGTHRTGNPPEPITRGYSLTLSDYLRDIMAGNYTPATVPFNAPPQGGGYNGFGTRYSGNWRGYGGDDWYGGYGGNPAWLNYLMGLYSWNIK